jgi:hypothetical protein
MKSLNYFCCLLLFAGCSKHKSEPRIVGKASDPPVSLHCVWQPGYRYQLRLEMAVLTDSGTPDPEEMNVHRVTFAQNCLVTATNAGAGGKIGLDMEIQSLAMERAKGGQVPLSFDSDQGGEATDDFGYIPVLKNMVGGHLQFLLSADGKMMRANGINEWVARALGDSPARTKAPRIVKRVTATNQPSVDAGSAPAAAPVLDVQPAAVTTSLPVAARRSSVPSTLRNFFTPDQFRQIIEFGFLPSAPVRVGEEWKTQGDTPISGHGRPGYDAVGKFEGWQTHGETNCARIAVRGNIHPPGAPPSPANTTAKKDTLQGTLWIDTRINFPATTILNTQLLIPDNTKPRPAGTNNVASKTSVVAKTTSKSVRQSVTITLIEATPIQGAMAESAGQ